MLVLGLRASLVVDFANNGTANADPAFLSIQLADLLSFGVLAASAILLRKQAAAHKRLILLATICICDAGFNRWWGDALQARFGNGFFGNWMADYFSDFLLIAALGIYDLATRRRLHKAYVFGAAWGLGTQLTAVWLYMSPAWKSAAAGLIGR